MTAPAATVVPALAACSAAPAPVSCSADSSLFSQVTLWSAQLGRGSVQPLPPPVVALSDAQIAEIEG